MGDELSTEIQALIEKLGAELPSMPDNGEALRRFEWLLDVLIMRGSLPPHFKKLASRLRAEQGVKIHLAIAPDKYQVESPDVDCAALMPICQARCCSLTVQLAEQDVEERVVPFVIDQPYMLPKDPVTKHCVCLDKATRGCTIYEHRPATCRSFDCREDRRIWTDFAARVLAPPPEE